MQAHHVHIAATLVALLCSWITVSHAADPRLKEVWYDPEAVVTVPVKRGVVTHIVLDAQESITELGTGLGADCSKPDASWCIAAHPGGRHIFVKPKSAAHGPNNVAVVTDKRSYALRFVVLPDGDARAPVYRLSIKARGPAPRVTPPLHAPSPAEPKASEGDVVAERLKAAPDVVNSNYSIAEGKASDDIVPALVFDDGRFTYFRFPNNREVPAIFHVLPDGTETLVNTRMEGDLLVADRVSRRLMLRAGGAVVGVWNEAFDIDGVAPKAGTTVVGVERALRMQSDLPQPKNTTGESHDQQR
jgi:type IV secretion system protein VirB9